MNVQSVLNAGYTAEQALNYISKMFPAFSKQVKSAAASGYSANEILRFVGQTGVKPLKKFAKGKSEGDPYGEAGSQNPLIQGAEANRNRSEEIKRNNPALAMGKVAGTAAAAYALSHLGLGSQATQAASQILGQGTGSQRRRNRPSETVIEKDMLPAPEEQLQLGGPQGQGVGYDEPPPSVMITPYGEERPDRPGTEIGYDEKKPIGYDARKQIGYDRPPEGALITPYNPNAPKPKPGDQEPRIEKETFDKFARAKGEPPPQQIKEKEFKLQSMLSNVISGSDSSGKAFTELMSSLKGEQSAKVFEQFGLDKFINKMAGKLTPKQIAKSLADPALEKALGMPIQEALDGYLSKLQQGNREGDVKAQETQELKTTSQEPPKKQLTQDGTTPSPIKQQKVEPKNSVFLPNGDLGKVISEKDGIAKVEVNGVVKHRKVDELHAAPWDEKETADIYHKLLDSLPEGHRSSHIYVTGYDPDNNAFLYTPQHGKSYMFLDVPEQFITRLQNKDFIAKTSGASDSSSWEMGDKTRGGGVAEFINEMRKYYKDTGKPHAYAFDSVHDLLKPARDAHKKHYPSAKKETKKNAKPTKRK